MSTPNPFGGPPLNILPKGTDPTEFGILQIVKDIEAEVDKHGWDQHHLIWCVTRDTLPLPGTFRGAGMGFGMAFVDVIESNEGTPDEVLIQLGGTPHRLRSLLTKHFPVFSDFDQIVALVFVGEAWMVAGQDAESEAEAHRLREQRLLHTAPGRVEVRQVVAVDRAEKGYVVARMRGQSDEQRLTTVHGLDAQLPFEGVAGLLAMVRALGEL